MNSRSSNEQFDNAVRSFFGISFVQNNSSTDCTETVKEIPVGAKAIDTNDQEVYNQIRTFFNHAKKQDTNFTCSLSTISGAIAYVFTGKGKVLSETQIQHVAATIFPRIKDVLEKVVLLDSGEKLTGLVKLLLSQADQRLLTNPSYVFWIPLCLDSRNFSLLIHECCRLYATSFPYKLEVRYAFGTRYPDSPDVNVERPSINQLAEKLRSDLNFVNNSTKAVICLQFDSQPVGRKGKGHYTPLIAYNEKEDLALVMDTAQHYAYYWASIESLVKGARTVNAVGGSRGWVLFYSL
mmetsp:Transcript_224/g.331  ORF Transcript_224/g.331 Transcript_224/m.331 type:complete len:294 (-) Transcript_224:2567-3448(-)